MMTINSTICREIDSTDQSLIVHHHSASAVRTSFTSSPTVHKNTDTQKRHPSNTRVEMDKITLNKVLPGHSPSKKKSPFSPGKISLFLVSSSRKGTSPRFQLRKITVANNGGAYIFSFTLCPKKASPTFSTVTRKPIITFWFDFLSSAETIWSFDGKLCQEYSYQKLSKSYNWFSSYSRKCRGCYFVTQCICAENKNNQCAVLCGAGGERRMN